jgi:phospholipase/lecithinase/hemolysin
MMHNQEAESMRHAIKRSVRPAVEGLEGRQLLSTTVHGHILPHQAAETSHPVALTGAETGTYTVRVERSSALVEQFRFQGKGTVGGLGAVRVTGDVTVREDLSQAGTASGVLTLTLPSGKGSTQALVSQTIPAHTGSVASLPFNYTVSGGTGLFRGGFDSGTGTFTRTSTTTVPGGAKGGFTVDVFSDHFTGLVAFGDSLTDVGNRYAASGGTDPTSPPYDAGRWSNGPLWIENLAAGLGLPAPSPSALGENDYAAADAGTATTGYAHNGSANIGTQIGAYLATHPTIDVGELFVIWGGTNDFGPHSTPDPAASVANLAAEITELAQAGAKQFLIPNLMPLGDVPALNTMGAAAQAKFNGLAAQFNSQLSTAEADLQAGLGIKIHALDVYSLVDQVLADPGRFGITDVTDQAKSGDEGDPGVVVANPDQYLFWDNIHPTETFEQLLGTQAIQAAEH